MVQFGDFFKHISGQFPPCGYRLDFMDRGAYVAQLTPLVLSGKAGLSRKYSELFAKGTKILDNPE